MFSEGKRIKRKGDEGANAGELIVPVVYAMRFGLTAKLMAETMLPYSTMVEAVRWAAAQF
jgi:pyruvate/2-oxoglutarate dehydrogenase complex dihydrolipoamide dehydrogenase (E3) component